MFWSEPEQAVGSKSLMSGMESSGESACHGDWLRSDGVGPAKTLLENEYPVAVWNRTSSKTEPLVAGACGALGCRGCA